MFFAKKKDSVEFNPIFKKTASTVHCQFFLTYRLNPQRNEVLIRVHKNGRQLKFDQFLVWFFFLVGPYAYKKYSKPMFSETMAVTPISLYYGWIAIDLYKHLAY